MYFLNLGVKGTLSIPNFPCSFTRNITSHSMENFAFHRLLRLKDYYATNSHYLTHTLLFKRLGECTFWTWAWKGSSSPECLPCRSFRPDFVLVRQSIRGIGPREDYRSILLGLQFGNVPSVNSLTSIYNCAEKPWVVRNCGQGFANRAFRLVFVFLSVSPSLLHLSLPITWPYLHPCSSLGLVIVFAINVEISNLPPLSSVCTVDPDSKTTGKRKISVDRASLLP